MKITEGFPTYSEGFSYVFYPILLSVFLGGFLPILSNNESVLKQNEKKPVTKLMSFNELHTFNNFSSLRLNNDNL